MQAEPEPWLRGPVADVHPLVMPVFHSFAQVREDLQQHVTGLAESEVWRRVGTTSLGFHLKHIAGSVDRLTTYLGGGALDGEQLRDLQAEAHPSGSPEELLDQIERQLARSEERLRTLDSRDLYKARTVGRRALPTSVLGLIVHLCEHTQRHLGQAIILAQLLKQKQE